MDGDEDDIDGLDAWDEAAVLIAKEIELWSSTLLETPSAQYGDLPPCPYARASWTRHSVLIHVTHSLDSVPEIKAFNPPTRDAVHIVAWTDYAHMTPHALRAWVAHQNDNNFGVWMHGLHPKSRPKPDMPPYYPPGADDYVILIMQSFSHLMEASNRLLCKTDYYKRYPVESMGLVLKRRDIYDAWKSKVSPTIWEAREENALQDRAAGEERWH